jgi:glycosyltransferase involved in cell wall biosynthesis
MLNLSICFQIKEYSRQIVDGRTLELFPNCVDSIVNSSVATDEIQIIVADYASTDWPLQQWLPQRARHIKTRIVPITGNFSHGRGRNCAAAHAEHHTLLFLDGDMLVTREFLRLSCQYVREGKAFVPIYQDLNDQGLVFRQRLDGYAALAISRSMFERVGRWPEFYSWGGDDTLLFARLTRIGVVVRHPVDGFLHQWHPEGQWKERFFQRPASSDYFDYVKAHPAS